jgi:hypothetical protein
MVSQFAVMVYTFFLDDILDEWYFVFATFLPTFLPPSILPKASLRVFIRA